MNNLFQYVKELSSWRIIMVAALVVVLCVGCVAKVELPAAASVRAMKIEHISDGENAGYVETMDQGAIEAILSALSGSRKTLSYSVNDYPTQNDYFIVRLTLAAEERTLCLYSEGNAYYVEEPYIGIYRSSKGTNNKIEDYYNEYVSQEEAGKPTPAPIRVDAIKDIVKGMHIDEVRAALGEPDGQAAGHWGDLYNLAGGRSSAAIYYDADGTVYLIARYSVAYDPDAEEYSDPYGTEWAARHGIYVNTLGAEIINQAALDAFVADAWAGKPTSLKSMYYTIEGDPIFTDYCYDGEIFTIAVDSTRDHWGGKTIQTSTYKYLVTSTSPKNAEMEWYVFTNTPEMTDDMWLNGGGFYLLQ
jgi:hypothetical protein